MTTYTMSTGLSEPVLDHIGVTTVVGTVGLPTASAGDVLLLAKVPTGSILLHYTWHCPSGGGGTWAPIGTSGSPSALEGLTFTFTGVAVKPTITDSLSAKIPLVFSQSDDAIPRFVWLRATCTAASTASSSHVFSVQYIRKPPGTSWPRTVGS